VYEYLHAINEEPLNEGLLLFVSGVPMLEKKWEGIEEWEHYKKKTSMFFPLPPRH
jgi:steroid 5-alpha reductase family enzyme